MCYVHVSVNIHNKVNTEELRGAGLELALESQLKKILSAISWLPSWEVKRQSPARDRGFDFEAVLAVPKGHTHLLVECKQDLRPSQFGALRQQREPAFGHTHQTIPVLAMPIVSSRVAELCEENDWSWFDLAGNCHIEVPGALYLDRRGNEPVHRPPRPQANLSTPAAGRVVRALLAPENAGVRWTQRSMENHFGSLTPSLSGPSLGLINKVIRHLRDQAWIEVSTDGGFRLRDPMSLLLAWRDAYRFDRHQRMAYFTLLQGKSLLHALYLLDLEAGGFAAYAAFSAAENQAPHVRQPKSWLYVDRAYVETFEKFTKAKLVDSGENLILLVPEDPGVFYMAEGGQVGHGRMASTNPVQTYVDLLHAGGRGEEAAEALLDQRLKPVWSREKLV